MAAGGSSGVAGDPGGGRADGHVGVPRLAQDRRAGTAGYDPDMLVGADVGVRARGEVLAGYGAAVRYRYVVPGDLRGEPARSCDVCAVPGGFRRAVGEFLRQVLVLRARLGMGRVGVVLDGMKIAASNSANPTEERLARWP